LALSPIFLMTPSFTAMTGAPWRVKMLIERRCVLEPTSAAALCGWRV
jgi:hypothetical protein